MSTEQYPYKVNELFLDYAFERIGPNGVVLKVISFAPQNVDGVTYFNLGFGDADRLTGTVNDLIITDNKDTEKVLTTVAATVLEFTRHFPNMPVYAKGSTPVRTRLYQMGISANWKEIEPILNVFGFVNEAWQAFETNVNYEAFLVFRKKS